MRPGRWCGLLDDCNSPGPPERPFEPFDPIWPNRDCYVLSPGHASALLVGWPTLGLDNLNLGDRLVIRRVKRP